MDVHSQTAAKMNYKQATGSIHLPTQAITHTTTKDRFSSCLPNLQLTSLKHYLIQGQLPI